jgi:hypothetical protein
MLETYYVGAYWLGRRELAAACARRAEDFFRLLAQLDSTWAHWFSLGRTRKQALRRPVEPTAATFEALFAQKKHQLPEHGFTFNTWNGEEHGHATRLNFSCGSSSQHSPDACVFHPPSRDPIAARVLTTPMMTAVLRAMALTWNPDKGVVMSHAHRDIVAPDKLPDVLVGWVTYLSRRRGSVPPLPAPVRVEPVEELGSLIILTPERFTASNPAHLELAANVRARLDQAGLLGPMRPWGA